MMEANNHDGKFFFYHGKKVLLFFRIYGNKHEIIFQFQSLYNGLHNSRYSHNLSSNLVISEIEFHLSPTLFNIYSHTYSEQPLPNIKSVY